MQKRSTGGKQPARFLIETDRLGLREFVEADAEAFHAFNSDPEVMRYTGEPLSESVDQARRAIRDYPDYRRHGYGRWAVVWKAERCVIGFNGLKYLDDLREVDLGYRFRSDCWGHGFATESSLAVVRYGFERLGMSRIIGLVMPENVGSIHVLEKVGMHYEGTVEYCGGSVQRWALDRSIPGG